MKSFSKYLHESVEGGSGSGKFLITKTPLSVARSFAISILSNNVFENDFKNFDNDYKNIRQLLLNTNNVLRKDMPVIRQKDISSFIDFLLNKNIKSKLTNIQVKDLLPYQSEIHLDKVIQNIKKFGKVTKNSKLTNTIIIISKNKTLIDGHHRWATVFLSDSNIKIKTLRVDYDTNSLIKIAREFSKGKVRI